MRTLIVGMGEVGTALQSVLSGNYHIQVWDAKWEDQDEESLNYSGAINPVKGQIEIMHICFPYSDKFIDYVKEYQEKYKPKYTVIHSTVPVGTSRICGAIHSPIRGLHPELSAGIRTFAKFLGGERASEVADYFRRCGLRVCLFDKSETTEAMKLFDTLYYGVCIEFAKDVKRYCDANGLNFHEVYTLANQSYNEGYTKLGHQEFVRPVLQPIMTPIGGHCVRKNADLIETRFTRLIRELNNEEVLVDEEDLERYRLSLKLFPQEK